ncbi:MAG: putative Xaa-Pro aminopeptidase P-like [Trebouxia sp. A1-2]|nr:MAG: putative Xaa-Pro aminopeptidase P-like [Trebouxia sp. A1-2]
MPLQLWRSGLQLSVCVPTLSSKLPARQIRTRHPLITSRLDNFATSRKALKQAAVAIRRSNCRAVRTFASTMQAVGDPTEVSAPGKIANDKVEQLRKEMAVADGGKGVSAYIIPTEDPHMSEYAPSCDERRHFISGFTGSAGTAVVTTDSAALWTDGRYFLQAEQQLGPGWTLMRAGTTKCPEIQDWLASSLPHGSRVGIDPFLHTVTNAKQLTEKLKESGKSLVPILEGNLVDKVWGAGRPAPPKAPLRIHKMEHAGQSVQDKLIKLRKDMQEAGAGALLVTALDEVAWLLNLRGGDVSYNPVFVSYVLVEQQTATLYVDQHKVGKEVAKHLKESGVEVKDYNALLGDIKTLAQAHTKLWADPTKASSHMQLLYYSRACVSYAITASARQAAGEGPPGKASPRKRPRTDTGGTESDEIAAHASAIFVEKGSPIAMAKAIKNKVEVEGMREAHLRDAVALCGLLAFLEKEIGDGRVMDEVEVDAELTARRKAQPGFVEASFPTIAGAGGNGAIIHYRAEKGSCKKVDKDTLLLLDSGGQFDCGTTDVTRTMHFGAPTDHQKMCFTRVLQGHIGLDQAIFPEGTPGLALDTLARAPLWSLGLNYRHGTGHGVGAALNVHEGPHSISTSNEPGYYEDNAFGIRIENLLHIREADTPFKFGDQSYFGFERLTMIPLQRKMILTDVLSKKEIEWVNSYHKEVWEKVSPRMQHDKDLLAWVKKNTQPL